jgi:CubicO group peptidase (beta-lactamase class C family)
MKFFQNDALKFQPGERYSYSTHAYTVLGAALEHATNKSFRQLVLDEITIKHKLPTLRPEDRSVPDPRRATLYENTAPQNSTAGAKPAIKNMPAKPDNISWKCPGGGLESTAPDLCRFGMKLLDGSLLRKTSTKQLWTARQLNNGKTTRYGLGWRIDSSDNHRYVAHSGSQLGARSYLRIYPEKEIVVVILSNCRSHQPQDLGEALSKLILQKPATDRQRLQPAP